MGILWALLSVFILHSLGARLGDPDLWWHLAAGREMVEQGRFLWTDIFSHSLFGQDWINFEWLSQILMILVWKGVGWSGLYAGKIFLSLLCLLLLARSIRQAGARGFLLFVLVWLGFFALKSRLNERPELFSLISLALFVGLIQKARESPA